MALSISRTTINLLHNPISSPSHQKLLPAKFPVNIRRCSISVSASASSIQGGTNEGKSSSLPRPLSSTDLTGLPYEGSRLRVAYQGVGGAYSESAAEKLTLTVKQSLVNNLRLHSSWCCFFDPVIMHMRWDLVDHWCWWLCCYWILMKCDDLLMDCWCIWRCSRTILKETDFQNLRSKHCGGMGQLIMDIVDLISISAWDFWPGCGLVGFFGGPLFGFLFFGFQIVEEKIFFLWKP